MDLQGKRVLVTGGAGYIGSHLTEELLSRDAAVHVVDNLFAGERGLVPEEATLHETDLRSRELQDLVGSVEPNVVYHLAALHYVPYCNEHPEETFRVNVMGTRKLLEALDGGLDSIVFASSAVVYPPKKEPCSEDDETGPIDIYSETKLVGEDLLRLHHHETGAPAVSARLFNVYGPRDTNPHLIPAIIKQLEDGRTVELGNLEPGRDYVHVEDAAKALVEIGNEVDEGYEVYNVGTGNEYSVREVVEKVEEALGEEVEIQQDEERMRETDRPHLRADTSKIRREIGWKARTDFVKGLRDLLDREGVV